VQFSGTTHVSFVELDRTCIVVRTAAFYASRVIMNTVVVQQLDGGCAKLSIGISTT